MRPPASSCSTRPISWLWIQGQHGVFIGKSWDFTGIQWGKFSGELVMNHWCAWIRIMEKIMIESIEFLECTSSKLCKQNQTHVRIYMMYVYIYIYRQSSTMAMINIQIQIHIHIYIYTHTFFTILYSDETWPWIANKIALISGVYSSVGASSQNCWPIWPSCGVP